MPVWNQRTQNERKIGVVYKIKLFQEEVNQIINEYFQTISFRFLFLSTLLMNRNGVQKYTIQLFLTNIC